MVHPRGGILFSLRRNEILTFGTRVVLADIMLNEIKSEREGKMVEE